MSRPPKLTLEPKRMFEIPFSGNVLAATQLTLLSGVIPFQFVVKGVTMVFNAEAMNQIRHYWLYGTDDVGSTTGVPSGVNIFSALTPVGYFTGHATIRKVDANILIPLSNARIKLHTDNLMNSAYDIVGSIKIQEV